MGNCDAAFNPTEAEVQTRSRTGTTFRLAGGTFSSLSQRQPFIAGSSCYAEVGAIHTAVKEANALVKLFSNLQFCALSEPIPIKIDAKGAISALRVTSNNSRSRHFESKFYYTREHKEHRRIIMVKTDSANQLADFLTKNLDTETHQRLHFFVKRLQMLKDAELQDMTRFYPVDNSHSDTSAHVGGLVVL